MKKVLVSLSSFAHREDKLRQKKRHGERGTDTDADSRKPSADMSSGSRCVSSQSPPLVQSNGQTIAIVGAAVDCSPTNFAVSDEPGGSNPDPTLIYNVSQSRNAGLGSPLSPTTRTMILNSAVTSAAPPPLFPHTTEADTLSPLKTGSLVVGAEQIQSFRSSKSPNASPQGDLPQILGATAALIGAGKAGAAAAIAVASSAVNGSGGRFSHTPIGVTDSISQGKPIPVLNALNGADDMNDVSRFLRTEAQQ